MPVQRRNSESGQAALLVVLALGTFLLGGVGLAIDASHLYAQRQRAQAAADAAAQAAILSVFNGTNQFSASGGTCASSAAAADNIPCYYASLNGFVAPADSVVWDAPAANQLRVTIQRTVPTSFMRLLGVPTFTAKASGTAAVLNATSALPIVVLHTNLSGAFSKNGSNDVIICGGPSISIQVNSGKADAVSVSGNSGSINLTHAGPLDAGNCSAGTGADFVSVGGPSSAPNGLLLGSLPGQYVQPAFPIQDPLKNMPAPAKPSIQLKDSDAVNLNPGVGDCPSDLTTRTSQTQCKMYSPGYYDQGINPSGFVIFRPGVYYINHNGLQLGSNTIARMAISSPYNFDPNVGDPAYTGWTQGMLIYNSPQSPINATKDTLSIAANSGKINNDPFPNAAACGTDPLTGSALGGNCLVGANGGALSTTLCGDTAALNASYYGTLFFQDRAVSKSLNHSVNGGGGLSLKGTIYAASYVTSAGTSYQTFSLQGNSGSTTTLQGQIIVDALSLGGTSAIAMNLNGLPCYTVRQVALIQ